MEMFCHPCRSIEMNSAMIVEFEGLSPVLAVVQLNIRRREIQRCRSIYGAQDESAGFTECFYEADYPRDCPPFFAASAMVSCVR